MTKKYGYLLVGMFCGAILAGSIGLAQNFSIEVEQPKLEYYVNGEEKIPTQGEEGFLYRDRTYVPVRFVAEALGSEVDWDETKNRITITDGSIATPTRHYYLDDSENLIVTDAGWNIIKTCKLRELKNLDAILAECSGYIDDFERQYHGFIGGYGDNAYLKILCVNETDSEKQVNARIYEYSLGDDSYRLIEDTINGEVNNYRMTEDKLLMWDDSKYVIYDTATQKKVEIPSGSQIQLTLDGEYLYYFLTSDGDKNVVYKQRIGSEEKEVLVEMPFHGYLRIIDGWLYCIDTADFNHFARVRLNGQDYQGE